jgi:transcriptional regulator with XRE-family HTH domain
MARTKRIPKSNLKDRDAAAKALSVNLTAPFVEPETYEEIREYQAQLIERLQVRMAAEGLTQAAFADQLDLKPAFITAIFNGFRWAPKSDRRSLEAFARYLQVPLIQIFIWSGFFGPQDLIVSSELPTQLDTVYKFISNDPLIRHVVPTPQEWEGCPQIIKLRFILLCEIVTSKALLDHAKMEYKEDQISNVEWILRNKPR